MALPQQPGYNQHAGDEQDHDREINSERPHRQPHPFNFSALGAFSRVCFSHWDGRVRRRAAELCAGSQMQPKWPVLHHITRNFFTLPASGLLSKVVRHVRGAGSGGRLGIQRWNDLKNIPNILRLRSGPWWRTHRTLPKPNIGSTSTTSRRTRSTTTSTPTNPIQTIRYGCTCGKWDPYGYSAARVKLNWRAGWNAESCGCGGPCRGRPWCG